MYNIHMYVCIECINRHQSLNSIYQNPINFDIRPADVYQDVDVCHEWPITHKNITLLLSL